MDKEKLKEIGEYIIKGMNERESCILVDVPYSTFITLKEKDESIRKFIEKKIVKFKLTHIETIQRTKSDKNSMYLLEKLLPDQFGNKKSGDGPVINIISAIIKSIQNDPANSIISFNRGEKQAIEENRPRILEGATLLD